MVTFLPLSTYLSGLAMGWLNPSGSLHKISLTALILSLFFKNAEECIWPVKEGDVRLCLVYPYHFGYICLSKYFA